MRLFSLVKEAPMPGESMLREFADRGEYTDCFVAKVENDVSFPAYVEAFYTTRLFRMERLILGWLISRPSSDEEARQLSRNEVHTFAAWSEYGRSDNQLVMIDFRQQTCSWFMLVPEATASRLYFGSAVMRDRNKPSGARMKWTYRALMGFHRLYSRALLQSAARRFSR